MNNAYDFVRASGAFDQKSYDETGLAATEYSVSLVKSDDSLGGSATLVSIDSHYGLLTADHVWRNVSRNQKKDHFCMATGVQNERFEYKIQECTPVVVGKYASEHEAEGPDLAFIRLDNHLKVATLKSRKSFYRLERDKMEIFTNTFAAQAPWIIWGAPGEGCSASSLENGEQILKIMHFIGHADFVARVERNGFDYVKVRLPAGSGNYPKSYGGVSGGGVWIPYLLAEDPDGKAIKPTLSLFLAGVAYYQFEESPGFTLLDLHGPSSIYERVIDEVRRTFPSAT